MKTVNRSVVARSQDRGELKKKKQECMEVPDRRKDVKNVLVCFALAQSCGYMCMQIDEKQNVGHKHYLARQNSPGM